MNEMMTGGTSGAKTLVQAFEDGDIAEKTIWGIGNNAMLYISDGGYAYYLFGSDGYWFAHGFAVKPVVVLKPNITIEQIYKIEDKEEEAWDATWDPIVDSGKLPDNGILE